MESQTKLFDSTKEFTIKILSGGEKVCTVRFPTDDEWMQRASRRRTISTCSGANKTRSKVVNGDALDAELFAKIRLTDGETTTFDEAEASAVISRLEQVTVRACARGRQVSHHLGSAGADHRAPAQDAAARRRGRLRRRVCLGDGRAPRERDSRQPRSLWKALRQDLHLVDGFAGAVPIVHKDGRRVRSHLRIARDGRRHRPGKLKPGEWPDSPVCGF